MVEKNFRMLRQGQAIGAACAGRSIIVAGALAAFVIAACEPASAADVVKKGAARPVEKRECLVADFRTISLSVHDPAARTAAVSAWLNERAKSCSLESLEAIRANRAIWLGTADTPVIAGLIDRLILAKANSDSMTRGGPAPIAPVDNVGGR